MTDKLQPESRSVPLTLEQILHLADESKKAAISDTGYHAMVVKLCGEVVRLRSAVSEIEEQKPVCWIKHGPYEMGDETEFSFENPKDNDCWSPLYASSDATRNAVIEEIAGQTKVRYVDGKPRWLIYDTEIRALKSGANRQNGAD